MTKINLSSKTILHCIVAVLCFCGGLNIASAEWKLEPAFEFGQRNAELDWSIAGNTLGTDPNIVSELTWSNLRINEAGFNLIARRDSRVYIRGYYLVSGKIVSGDNQDSDYAFNDRQGEFSRSNNSGSSGSTFDIGVGVGYPIFFTKTGSHRLTWTPMLGASYHQQNLTMKNGVQTLSDTALARTEGYIGPTESIPPVGFSLNNLNSSYDSEWATVWLGLDMLWQWRKHTKITANAELHFADYSAAANWNLRNDLEHPVSFAQWSNGIGFVMSLGYERKIDEQLSVGISLDYQYWETDSGLAQFYETTLGAINTQFNGVTWTSNAVHLRVSYEIARP